MCLAQQRIQESTGEESRGQAMSDESLQSIIQLLQEVAKVEDELAEVSVNKQTGDVSSSSEDMAAHSVANSDSRDDGKHFHNECCGGEDSCQSCPDVKCQTCCNVKCTCVTKNNPDIVDIELSKTNFTNINRKIIFFETECDKVIALWLQRH